MRPYCSGDLEGVVAIFRSNIPKYFLETEESELRDFLDKFSDGYFVGEQDGEIVAAVASRRMTMTPFRCVGEWCGTI